MQLRKCVTVPNRFEDEVHVGPASRNGTKPAFPAMLKDQIVAFNPNNPPAAFPSLPLTSVNVSAAKNPERSQELLTLRPSLNFLSTEGLRISLAGSSSSEEDIPQTKQETIKPVTTENNTGAPVGPIANGPNSAKVPSTASEVNNDVTWTMLPLSLQSHIYKALSANYPSKIVPKLLGLTEHEAGQIQKAVGMRILHPASVEEIWNYCSNATVEDPGTLQPPSSIDAGIFNEYVGYMVYASNHELAFQSEVSLAKHFLSSRGIATELLGTWLPDPSDAQIGGLCRHVPGTTSHPALLNNQLHNDSGYSSFSEADQTPGAQCSQRRPQSRQNLVKNKMTGIRSTVPTAPISLVHPTQHRPPLESALLDLNPNLMVRISPHPRSIFTKDGEFLNTPGGTFFNARDLDGEIQPSVPQAGKHFRDSAGRDTCRQLATQSSEARPPTGITSNPQRLILRIQNKNGVARILRKNLSPMDCTQHLSPPKAGDTTAVSLNGLEKPSRPSSLSTQVFSPNTSEFSKGPTVKDVGRPPNSATFEITFMSSEARPSVSCQPAESDSSKRKPSQSDIRQDISKVQRMLINVASEGSSKAILQDWNSDINQLHTEANRFHKLPTAHRMSASETDTLSKAKHIISSIELTRKTTGTTKDTIPVESMKPRPLRSPSYSPISENEDLEEFQVRLRGPMTDSMRGKVPDQYANLSSQSDLSHILSSLSNPAVFCPAKPDVLSKDKQGQREGRIEHPFHTRSRKASPPSAQSQDPPQGTVNDIADGQEAGLAQHQPRLSSNAQADRSTTSEQTSVITPPEKTSQEKSTSQKKRGKKRGPRGPYRKTRERLARLATEEANADTSEST
ncbi:hypothetical protein AYL99_07419 [Fonsecaea erecta]|uniref:Uncharacterized protein n=1 Tax=Fonsecaea erecta TaxID=1367422 RepID=A0A178ZEW6_9EURO|nr:hypothetical protein AYL99_07419 [Fonsecaea erecta]OAP58329.1 hypothetical protein AYL99_07419 [Fonsecaea erecta]